ncbi:hypothetical protein HNR62_000333 [Oceanisphaera litoralis]|uniref:hypothetical protein n=1 Tax=Oceanisphaera litoralis TaxID=225144 RepID=UPI00195E59DC|nr:hypothetical protein [Oceanisphaera litoralis]MBM7454504.1 hypothetical protein [Oceanisphaera litoralis]
MKGWTRCTKGIPRTIPLYVRRLNRDTRQFAVLHPTRGWVELETTTRESCYTRERMKQVAAKARHALRQP